MRILEERMLGYKDIAVDLMHAIIDTLESEDIPNVFTRGMTNMLNFQEFNDIEKAKKLFEVLEQKPYLYKMLKHKPSTEVNISIGEENGLEPMKECSIITTSYEIGDYNLGTIGIIGPTRMNYGQVVSLLEHISHHIKNMLIEAKE